LKQKERRNMSKESNVEDIWTKLQKQQKATMESATTGEDVEGSASNITINQQMIFVGDAGSGKSTLIQTFIKPNAAKDIKPTIALEYNFARKTVNNTKYVANLWEVGGDFLESKYLTIPLNKDNLKTSAIVICCDLSKPHNVIVSVLRSISAIREILKKAVADLQATNVVQLNQIKESITSAYKGHPDANRVKPLEVPLVIIGNKQDSMRAMPLAERRAVIQALRFIAHYFGGILLMVSVNDSNSKEFFRSLMNSLCFHSPMKPSNETNVDKVVYITRGMDSFQNILVGNLANETADNAKVVNGL
jgi:dynein light intermediate chain 2